MPHHPSSPLLDRDAAVAADGLDEGVAAHYGRPSSEQRHLLDGTGWVDLSHRDVIRIDGPDRLNLLHAITTQTFDRLVPGVWVQALILSPQGHIEHGFEGIDDGTTFTAHTEPGAGPALVTFLEQMKFMLRVEARLVDDLAVIATREGSALVLRTDLADRSGEPVGTWAYEALRIEQGRPRIGLDSDHRTIPNELGLLGTSVQLEKGCYRGQETVARVHNLGRPPRRLTLLLLDGSADELPAHGAPILAGDREVGQVGSSARHHELGPIALALIKRSVPVESTLLVGGVAAAQEPVVDPDIGLHVRAMAARGG